MMNPEEKKAFVLLKAVILYYHGLDEEERKILEQTAQQYNAQPELDWALQFIQEDYLSAFDRARDFLSNIISPLTSDRKIDYLLEVWKDNNKKGYITEMEATAIINLARDRQIQRDFISVIRQ